MKFKRERFVKTLNHKNRFIFIESLLQNSLIFLNFLALGVLVYFLVRSQPLKPARCVTVTGLLLTVNLIQSFFIFYFRRKWIEMERQAEIDGRTGLLTRVYFEKMLDQEVRRAGRYRFPLAMCVLDLDSFASFNENFGPRRGDELLKQFGDFLRASVRFTDSVCHDTSDQFYAMLPHTDLVRAQKFLARLLAQAQERLDISFSAGLSVYQSGETPAQFLERISVALKQAKREGKKQIRCLVHGEDSHAIINF